MKALSLLEPWASLVALGEKRIETRSWAPPQGIMPIRIAIHASKSREAIDDGTAEELFGMTRHSCPDPWPLGRVVAVVTLVKAVPTEKIRDDISHFHPNELAFGNYSDGRWGWVFDDLSLRRLAEPVPCRGMLGLWGIPQDVRAKIDAQLAVMK
jgi:hypothetical protein